MFDTIIDNCGTAFEVFYLKGLIHFKTDDYNKQTLSKMQKVTKQVSLQISRAVKLFSVLNNNNVSYYLK